QTTNGNELRPLHEISSPPTPLAATPPGTMVVQPNASRGGCCAGLGTGPPRPPGADLSHLGARAVSSEAIMPPTICQQCAGAITRGRWDARENPNICDTCAQSCPEESITWEEAALVGHDSASDWNNACLFQSTEAARPGREN